MLKQHRCVKSVHKPSAWRRESINTVKHTFSQSWCSTQDLQLWRPSAPACLLPISKITVTQQSHYDEWALIGTENCFLVVWEVCSGDSILLKWNQSSVFVQFFPSHPLFFLPVFENITLFTLWFSPNIDTDILISVAFPFLFERSHSIRIPISLNETAELFSGEIWQYALPSFPWFAADKPSTQNNTLGQLLLLTSHFASYHVIHRRGGVRHFFGAQLPQCLYWIIKIWKQRAGWKPHWKIFQCLRWHICETSCWLSVGSL